MDLSEIPSRPFSRHPWELARAQFFLRVIERSRLLQDGVKILDVGSGDSYFARRVLQTAQRQGPAQMMCWDSAYSAKELAAASTGDWQKTATAPQQKFDGIIMLDVLEHVAEDIEFLRNVVDKNLKDQGWALISVPAWNRLFSCHDAQLAHHRRYAPRAMRPILSAAGLQVERSGGLFHSLLPVRMMQKSTQLFRGGSFRAAWQNPRQVGCEPNAVVKREIAPRATGLQAAGAEQDVEHGLGAWQSGPMVTKMVLAGLGVDTWVSMQLGRLGAQAPGLSWWALCTKR